VVQRWTRPIFEKQHKNTQEETTSMKALNVVLFKRELHNGDLMIGHRISFPRASKISWNQVDDRNWRPFYQELSDFAIVIRTSSTLAEFSAPSPLKTIVLLLLIIELVCRLGLRQLSRSYFHLFFLIPYTARKIKLGRDWLGVQGFHP